MMTTEWLQSSNRQLQVIMKLWLILWIATIVHSTERNHFNDTSLSPVGYKIKNKYFNMTSVFQFEHLNKTSVFPVEFVVQNKHLNNNSVSPIEFDVKNKHLNKTSVFPVEFEINNKYLNKTLVSSVEFVIKNKHTMKYVRPVLHSTKFVYLCLYDTYIEPTDDEFEIFDSYFVFEPVQDYWGYIKHVQTGAVWCPGAPGHEVPAPEENDLIYLLNYEERKTLFAIDQLNSHIIHRDGMFLHHFGGAEPYISDRKPITLHPDIHVGMEWILENPNNPSQEVYPYGKPTILGKWRLIYYVDSPLATQTKVYTYRTGKSRTESTVSTFQLGFEVSASAMKWFIDFSATASLSAELEITSTETWYEETEVTHSIEVTPGQSVYIWQRFYIGEQIGHTATFQSDGFAHRPDDTPPDDDKGPSYYNRNNSSSLHCFMCHIMLMTLIPLCLAILS